MNLVVEGGRKEESLTPGNTLQNWVESVSEPHVEHDVGLVNDEHLQVDSLKSISFFQVLKKPSRGANEHIHDTDFLLFILNWLSTDDQSNTDFHMMSKGVEHFKHLHGQLPDRDQDDGTETVDGHNFISI
jgi:hypothetical protein